MSVKSPLEAVKTDIASIRCCGRLFL